MENAFIRAAAPEDAEALLEIYAPYVQNTAVSFEYDAPCPAEFRARMERTLEKYPYLEAVCGGEILGYAYTGPFKERRAYDWSAETTIYLRADARRRGLGSLLYRALERASAAQNIKNLNACIAFPEAEDEFLTRDSALFHSRMGYRTVGEFHSCAYKFGRWYNMIWMEKAVGPHSPAPLPFVPFPQLAAQSLLSLGILPRG